jgi:hypothetical protein
MWCLIPLLENIDFIVQFALQHDVFICDLVLVIKICQGSFYTLYNEAVVLQTKNG